LYSEENFVENNMEEDIDLILAVGAGTIHDISRYIAHNYKVPFISVPTAASGDGFVTTVAAMTLDGVKKTVRNAPSERKASCTTT
jgi:glycerol-1-phosphate dehydrogenase [NAD(P)+]